MRVMLLLLLLISQNVSQRSRNDTLFVVLKNQKTCGGALNIKDFQFVLKNGDDSIVFDGKELGKIFINSYSEDKKQDSPYITGGFFKNSAKLKINLKKYNLNRIRKDNKISIFFLYDGIKFGKKFSYEPGKSYDISVPCSGSLKNIEFKVFATIRSTTDSSMLEIIDTVFIQNKDTLHLFNLNRLNRLDFGRLINNSKRFFIYKRDTIIIGKLIGRSVEEFEYKRDTVRINQGQWIWHIDFPYKIQFLKLKNFSGRALKITIPLGQKKDQVIELKNGRNQEIKVDKKSCSIIAQEIQKSKPGVKLGLINFIIDLLILILITLMGVLLLKFNKYLKVEEKDDEEEGEVKREEREEPLPDIHKSSDIKEVEFEKDRNIEVIKDKLSDILNDILNKKLKEFFISEVKSNLYNSLNTSLESVVSSINKNIKEHVRQEINSLKEELSQEIKENTEAGIHSYNTSLDNYMETLRKDLGKLNLNEKKINELKNTLETVTKELKNCKKLNKEIEEKFNEKVRLATREAKKILKSLDLIYKFRKDIAAKYSNIFDSDKLDRLYLGLSNIVLTLVTLYISAELIEDEKLKEKVNTILIRLEENFPSLKELREALVYGQKIEKEEINELLERFGNRLRSNTGLFIFVRDYSTRIFSIITEIIKRFST